MRVKYSVVIPLYNKEDCIEKTIQSVLAQTNSDYEIVVIDDGSVDQSADVVKAINDERIRLISQKNQGVSAARNTGISNSNGKYVCFLDADDLWMPDFLETVDQLIMDFPDAKMFCPSYQVAYGNRMVLPKWKSVDLVSDSLVEDFFEMATGPFWVCHSSCAVVERTALEDMEYWYVVGEKVYEDFDFWLRLGTRIKVAHSNKVCATYIRITNDNARITHSKKVVFSEAYMKTLNTFLTNNNLTRQQLLWIREIKDRRMVPYIFSLVCTRQRDASKHVLKEWKPVNAYKKYKLALSVVSRLPYFMIKAIQLLRYYIF